MSNARPGSKPRTKSKSGLRNVGRFLKQFFGWLLKEHWKEIVAWVLSGGALLIHELWLKLIPIPNELANKAMLWWLIMSLAAITIVGVHFDRLRSRDSHKRRSVVVRSMLGTLAGFALVGPILFYAVEWWWKQPNAPSDFIYNHLEPLAYGLLFAFLTAFIAYVVLLLADVLSHRTGAS